MAVKLFHRIYKAVSRKNKDSYRHKQLNETKYYVDAGQYFIERCDSIIRANDNRKIKKNSSKSNLNRLSGISLKSYNEIGQQRAKRRNAIFELSEDERVGLSLVLKTHIQTRRLLDYGML